MFDWTFFILLPANNLTFEVYETECGHKIVGICFKTHEYIETIFKLGTKKTKSSSHFNRLFLQFNQN